MIAIRLSPVLFLALAASAYVLHVEPEGAYPWRNLLPIALAVALAIFALYRGRGRGRWAGAGREWPAAIAGYTVPSVGITLYLHHAYATDLHGTYSNAIYPEELFRYLPAFSLVAGATGFAIGWIIGRSAGSRP